MQNQESAQRLIESKFQRFIEQDVSSLAPELEHSSAAKLNQEITQQLQARFVPTWDDVFLNPGGTAGHHSRYLTAKLNWLLALAEQSENAMQRGDECLAYLTSFWCDWAGYQVTSSESLLIALNP